MSQKIKKQIKKSMPFFVIVSLITSSVAVGIVFNFDFNLYRLKNSNLNLSLTLPEVQADTATTSVEVRNAPPAFYTGMYPYEDPSSTSTSPIINGTGTMTFKGMGDDPEGAQYFLAVCGTNGVTAHAYNPPTCNVETFCISASTTDETLAVCTSTAITTAAETKAWYAFVCDGHGTDPGCSSYSQGSNPNVLATSSPFYVDHAPTIDLTLATINNQEAGGTFGFTATSTDTDTTRGGDMIHLYICDNGGFSTSTIGCVGTRYCNASSTASGASPLGVSCSWASSIPTADNTYNYYAYILDEFYMEGTNNGTSSTYTIINSVPVVDGVYLAPTTGNDIVLNIKGAAEKEVTASTTDNQVYDKNGCTDLQDATSTIYWSGATGGYACTADDDDCYKTTNATCVINDCSGGSDAYATVVCTTTMAFHAVPTDASATYQSTTTWYATIFAYDEAATGASTTLVGTDVHTNTALAVTEDEIDYDIITAGQNTGTDSATTTVENYGNSPIDVYLYGTDMTKVPDSIDIAQQKHDLLYQFDYTSAGTNATDTPSTNLEDTDIARPQSDALTKNDYVYWGIGIPGATPSGIYEGVNTFQVYLDTNGTW